MILSGQQSKILQKALIDAFPNKSSLEQMLLFNLDKSLNAIAGGDNLGDIVFQLITTAKAENWIEDLISAALTANPRNQLLKDIAEDLIQKPELIGTDKPPSTEAALQSVNAEMTPGLDDQAIEVFFSYAHEDEKLRDKLAKHLSMLKRNNVITDWYDRQIMAGSEWQGQIDEHLETAKVILLLVSADFLASDYCYDVELKRAMQRHEAKEARVIPVILREVDWKGASFSKLQALPKNGEAVTNWQNSDQAFADIARGIGRAVEELTGKKS